jgi:hypothetical protein
MDPTFLAFTAENAMCHSLNVFFPTDVATPLGDVATPLQGV